MTRILILDRDPTAMKRVSKKLGTYGFDAYVHANPEDAITSHSMVPYKVAVLDNEVMNGNTRTLVAQLKSADSVVYLSGPNQKDWPSYGADGYIYRGAMEQQLLKALAKGFQPSSITNSIVSLPSAAFVVYRQLKPKLPHANLPNFEIRYSNGDVEVYRADAEGRLKLVMFCIGGEDGTLANLPDSEVSYLNRVVADVDRMWRGLTSENMWRAYNEHIEAGKRALAAQFNGHRK